MQTLMLIALLFFTANQSFAAEVDNRFRVHVYQEQGSTLTVEGAMTKALPVLWKRVVPVEGLEKARRLRGRTSLVLQFKAVKRGVDLVFNPVQVKRYLRGAGVNMIPEQPSWKLNVSVVGFSESDDKTALDLMNYSYAMADEFGFELSPRGRKLQLIFAPVVDEYGEAFIHVDVQGAFSSDLLRETSKATQGYLSYQLQAWVDQILLEIRDAYSLGSLQFNETGSEVLLTIESDYTLASQVSLEQALLDEPAVIAVVPVLLQKVRRQYRLVLRGDDDSWIKQWFSSHGLTAEKQPEGSASQWLVQ